MTTILPSAPPPRSPLSTLRFSLPRLRMPAFVLAVLVLGLGAAAGARAWAGRLPAPDRPSGKQLPLTTTVELPAGPLNPAFRISLPAEPRFLAQPRSADENVLGVPLGTPGSALLMAGRDDRTTNVDRSLDDLGLGQYRVGPLRRVSVAGRRAVTRDMFFGNKVVHEYRFDVDGAVYGFGIVTTVGDEVARDTGLAAMATFKLL